MEGMNISQLDEINERRKRNHHNLSTFLQKAGNLTDDFVLVDVFNACWFHHYLRLK